MDFSTAQRGPRKFTRQTRLWFSRRLKEPVEHLGHTPSVPEEIVLHRVIALEWELRKFDARVEEEGFDGLSGHVLRARLAR